MEACSDGRWGCIGLGGGNHSTGDPYASVIESGPDFLVVELPADALSGPIALAIDHAPWSEQRAYECKPIDLIVPLEGR